MLSRQGWKQLFDSEENFIKYYNYYNLVLSSPTRVTASSTRGLPIRASARLVVPGYKDLTAYELRKDAPTASRTSQHLLFSLTPRAPS